MSRLICEVERSFIAEWAGVALSAILEAAGIHPHADFVKHASIQTHWNDSIDMADARRPQTLLTYAMNGAELRVDHGRRRHLG